MQILKSKTIAIMIAIFLMISMSASMMLTNATPSLAPGKISIPIIAFCNVGTNPDGVGQAVNIGFWLNLPPPTAIGVYGDRWQNMTLTVTTPGGTTTTLGPFSSDDTGGAHTSYTPTTVGTYSFQMSFPGQVLAGVNAGPIGSLNAQWVGDYYEPAVSNVATMTVQTAPVGGVSVAPLPTSYWQTPINAMNVNNWYAIGGAWLGLGSTTGHTGMYNSSANYNPYTTAPLTSHILWTKPEAFGGVLGGQFGGTTTYGNYYATAQYEKKFSACIINGFLYYNEYPGSSTTTTGLLCVNLYTGQTVWDDNSNNYGGGSPQYNMLTSQGLATTFLVGQVLDYVSPNQYGGLAYIWTDGTPAWIINSEIPTTGDTLNMFDAETGTYILSIINCPGGFPFLATMAVDASGNLLAYYINSTAGTQEVMGNLNDLIGPSPTQVTSTGPTLNQWNSTECIMAGDWFATGYPMESGWMWRPPQDGLINFETGLQWSTQLPTSLSGSPLPAGFAINNINSGTIVCNCYSPGPDMIFMGPYEIYAGFSQTTGQQLWIENLTVASYVDEAGASCTSDQYTCGDGVWTIANYQTSVLTGLSMTTGKVIWTDKLTPFDPYDSIGGWMMNLANGTLFVTGFGGDIWSINILSGKINWYTNTTTLVGPSGTNTPYGVWPIWVFSNGGIADGVLYLEEGHEYSPPLFLGARQLAINCTNGKLVWSIEAFDVDGLPYIAYGIMTILNAYDNQIYAYGMGPSKTTVTAPDIGVTTSTPITITGTVTDISAGSQQSAVAANFPNGLPCVSDASMSAFMEAVYEQQPMPTNIIGVPVTLTETDHNGNTYTIGTTTSDSSGTFAYNWTPPIPGNYTIAATFAGSNAYYGSCAETHIYASSPAPTAAPTASPPTGLATSSELTYGIIAVIIVIIVAIAIVGLLLLRKKP
jgi:hypothetical protein